MPEPIARVKEAARLVAAFAPDLGRWAAGYGANPPANWVSLLRAAGWPARTETVAVAYPDERRGYAATRVVDQPVAVVPESWLRALCALVAVPYREGEAYRRLVGPAPTEETGS